VGHPRSGGVGDKSYVRYTAPHGDVGHPPVIFPTAICATTRRRTPPPKPRVQSHDILYKVSRDWTLRLDGAPSRLVPGPIAGATGQTENAHLIEGHRRELTDNLLLDNLEFPEYKVETLRSVRAHLTHFRPTFW
jgi:hypothetical protein